MKAVKKWIEVPSMKKQDRLAGGAAAATSQPSSTSFPETPLSKRSWYRSWSDGRASVGKWPRSEAAARSRQVTPSRAKLSA